LAPEISITGAWARVARGQSRRLKVRVRITARSLL
jgi:hypothetical protein